MRVVRHTSDTRFRRGRIYSMKSAKGERRLADDFGE
jgi:hypothetical protein